MEEGDYELVDITIRINPNDFGLIEGDAQQRAQRNRYEVWRFTVLNDERIIGVQYLIMHTAIFLSTLESQTMIPQPGIQRAPLKRFNRSEEHTSELQSLIRNSYAAFCLKKKNKQET